MGSAAGWERPQHGLTRTCHSCSRSSSDALPFLVPLGLHWPLNALILMNIQTLGYDFVQGPMGVWNFACFGATAGVLVLAVRGKDSAMRQTAVGALLAGLLGAFRN